MAEKKISLHFFQLTPVNESDDSKERSQQLEAISNVFKTLPSSYNSIKLEEFEIDIFGNIESRDQLYFGTFIKSQIANIPPSYNHNKKTLQPLPLDEDHGLGYQTSFIYDPNYRILMIESLRNGVSANTFCAFLKRNFDIPNIEPALVINPEKQLEFDNMTSFYKLSAKVARLESGSLFKARKNSSVGQMIHTADVTNTDYLDYTIGVYRRSHSLNKANVRKLVNQLKKYDDTKEVKKLIVNGEDADGYASSVDFIEQKLVDSIKVKKQRLIESFEIRDHYEKLYEAYSNHRENLKVYKVKSKH